MTQVAPNPKRKSRRTGDTAAGFRLHALDITQRKVKAITARMTGHIVPAVWDLLDWLRLWEPTQHDSDLASIADDDAGVDGGVQDFVPTDNYQQTSGLFPEP